MLAQELGSASMDLPRRKDAVGLGNASHVLSAPIQCYPNAPLEFHAFKVSARRQSLGPQPSSAVQRSPTPDVLSVCCLAEHNARRSPVTGMVDHASSDH